MPRSRIAGSCGSSVFKDSVSSLCSYLFESTFICIKDSARGDLLGVLHVYRRLNKKSRPGRYFG